MSRLARVHRSQSQLTLALFGLFCLLCWDSGAALASQDDIVPEGAWKYEAAVFVEAQQSAYNRFGKLRSLKRLLIPKRADAKQTSGSIIRKVNRADFRFTYGVSDTWNLFLEVPYLQLEQDSSLKTSSTDPLIQAQVATLRSQSLTGLGDFRMFSMHRTVFSDRNGFVVGYGLIHPIRDRDDSRPGALALALRSPHPSLSSFIHYTRYPALRRSRFDIRLQFDFGLDGHIKALDGKKRKFEGGNDLDIQLGWHKEFGAFGTGFNLNHRRKTLNRLGGGSLGDPEEETLFRLRAGYGNLVRLEQGALNFPYQLILEFDRSLDGFNVPYSDGITLSLQTYF